MLEQRKLVVNQSLLIKKTHKFLVFMTEILIGTLYIKASLWITSHSEDDRGQAILH